MPPPIACRWLVRAASWIAPRRARPEWRARWESGLRTLWTLVERGELAADASAQMLRHCAGAFADAFWLRFRRQSLRNRVRGPAFPLLAAAAVLLMTAALTGGFSTTRAVVRLALAAGAIPPDPRQVALWDAQRSNTLFMYTAPIAFALLIAVIFVTLGRLSLGSRGWRYWQFLALKTSAVLLTVPLLWIEVGAAIRSHLPGAASVLLGGLLFTLAFIVAFAWALWWSFADQRRRCPVCLQRLAMPVRIGSWASMFEPPTTELLCEEGHGSLCMPETEGGEPDRWTALDASWRELFEHKPR